jgi:hypothetical protein
MPTAPLRPVATLGIAIGKSSLQLIELDQRGPIICARSCLGDRARRVWLTYRLA